VSIEWDPRLCFVVMPMTERFERIYEHVIKPTVAELGMHCVYAGEISGAGPIMDDVWQYCAKARVVIADLTDANTNVYYEAGYAHAFDKEKVVIITQDIEDVTFDLRHFRCIVYDPGPGTVEDFRQDLTQNLKAVLEKYPEGLRLMTRVIDDTLEGPVSDPEVREALGLYRIVRSAQRGHAIVADERVERVRHLLDMTANEHARVSPIKPGRHTVVNVDSAYALRAHVEPGSRHEVAGAIPPYGRGIMVTGDGTEIDGQVWVPITYEALTGWVRSSYLARQEGWVDDTVAAVAVQMIMALKHEDMDTLATLVHPEKGVRFSPFAYVGGWDLVFSADQLGDALGDATRHRWGADQASGDPIDLTFLGYYDRFIYDVDFARPDVVYFNHHFQSGHCINNIPEAYPGAATVEYQFEGIKPESHGLDWRGLRLVLEQEAGRWYLVGVTHDEMGV
jgi:hypothetical protein